MYARIAAIQPETVLAVHPRTLATVFWEVDPNAQPHCDTAFEKEAWLHAALMAYGSCGYNVLNDAENSVIGTLLWAAPSMCPGTALFPTAPVSSDAFVLTSLHMEPSAQEHIASVIDAAIMALMHLEVPAIEAFAWREDFVDDPENPQPAEVLEILDTNHKTGLMCATVLESAGFEVAREHPALPKYRLELPPKHWELSAQNFSCLSSSSKR